MIENVFSSQFWLCQYAKRKLFIDERQRYGEIVSAAELLEKISRELYGVESSQIDDSICEYHFLMKYRETRSVKSMLGDVFYEEIVQDVPNADHLIELACSISEKYGFVLNHILFDPDETIPGRLNYSLIYLVLYYAVDPGGERTFYAISSNGIPYEPRMQTFPFKTVSEQLFSYDENHDTISFKAGVLRNIGAVDGERYINQIVRGFEKFIVYYRYCLLRRKVEEQMSLTVGIILKSLGVDCFFYTSKDGRCQIEYSEGGRPCSFKFFEIIKEKIRSKIIFDYDTDCCPKAYLKDILNAISSGRKKKDYLVDKLGLSALIESEDFRSSWRKTLIDIEDLSNFEKSNKADSYVDFLINLPSDASGKDRVNSRILSLYFWDAQEINEIDKNTAWNAMVKLLDQEEMLDKIIPKDVNAFKMKVTNTLVKTTRECIEKIAIFPMKPLEKRG